VTALLQAWKVPAHDPNFTGRGRELAAHADLLPEPLSSTAAGDQVAFAETMALLVDYSLARRSLAGLQLHRLVQGAIRSRYDGPSPPADGGPLAVAMGLLCADAPEQAVQGGREDRQARPEAGT
jgi:hypothetical protein